MTTTQFFLWKPVSVLSGLLLALLFSAATTGCSGSGGTPYDVSGHLPDLQFQMQSDQGTAVDARGYRKKLVLLYFGFTSCRDVCPDTLARLGAAVARLGAAGQRVQTLFVTVDPARDSAAALHAYLDQFAAAHPVGLRGDERSTLALVKRYRVAYRPAGAANTDPVHGVAVYVFDGKGHARMLIGPDDSAERIAAALRQVLAQP